MGDLPFIRISSFRSFLLATTFPRRFCFHSRNPAKSQQHRKNIILTVHPIPKLLPSTTVIYHSQIQDTWNIGSQSRSMRIFVGIHRELTIYRLLSRKRPPFAAIEPPSSAKTRKNCVKKRYFRVKSDAARAFFFRLKRRPVSRTNGRGRGNGSDGVRR